MENQRLLKLVIVIATLTFTSFSAFAAPDFPGRPSRGPSDAAVQIVEFSDFQCAHCSKMAPVLAKVVGEYGDLVNLKVVTITAPGHTYSEPAAELALTAAEQGKFWEAYDALFANQSKFTDEYLLALAGDLGLDVAEVKANIENGKHRAILKENFMGAVSDMELEVTPTLLIGGEKHTGAKNADYYRYYINQVLAEKGITSPVGEVTKPPEKTSAQSGRVPLDLIYPVPRLKPNDSVLNVKVGDKAPDFELPTILAGTTVKLSSYRGDKNVVVSFVPAAWTPQCSAQWPEYNEYEKEFAALDTAIIGVSVDNIPSLYSWTVSMGRPWFHVASDFWPHGRVADEFGVLRTDGTTERAVFVIDKNGVIRYIDVHDVNSRPAVDKVIEEVKKLQEQE
jgi:peroxiredoxin/predicted DsbA family dithiol-disulfide isomerase